MRGRREKRSPGSAGIRLLRTPHARGASRGEGRGGSGGCFRWAGVAGDPVLRRGEGDPQGGADPGGTGACDGSGGDRAPHRLRSRGLRDEGRRRGRAAGAAPDPSREAGRAQRRRLRGVGTRRVRGGLRVLGTRRRVLAAAAKPEDQRTAVRALGRQPRIARPAPGISREGARRRRVQRRVGLPGARPLVFRRGPRVRDESGGDVRPADRRRRSSRRL